MILFRYLLKEVFVTLIALTTILLFIFMSNQAVVYLNRAANGSIPGIIILRLMMCELPGLACLLLPLGFYISVLLSYGRMYADNEMICMYSGGYSPFNLLKQTLFMAICVAVCVAWFEFQLSPNFAYKRAEILRTTGIKTIIQTLSPAQFKNLASDKIVFYVESVTLDHDKAENIFLTRRLKDNIWQVIWSEQAFAVFNPKTNEDDLILAKGHAYIGNPQKLESKIVDFDKMRIQLPKSNTNPEDDIRVKSIANLWSGYGVDPEKTAELQWRLSIPLMVLILTLIAVPLSRVEPRAGKFSNLLVAILVYMLYANFMFVARNWLVKGIVPVYVGMSWLHIIFLILGILLIRRDFRNY